MARQALIVWGGWEGHFPQACSELTGRLLREEGFEVAAANSLEVFKEIPSMRDLRLIVPIWSMGTITPEQLNPVLKAVRDDGVGLGGCHGGMCDAFRDAPEWQFMTGGQWVAHPGDNSARYTVKITAPDHPIMRDLADFQIVNEQYYMHVDPGVKVLATTHFPVADGPHVPNGPVAMPVVWTKFYGRGNVFYSSLAHDLSVMESEPCRTILRRGLAWAAKP